MKVRIQPEAPQHGPHYKMAKRFLRWGLTVLVVVIATVKLVSVCRFYYVAEELPPYTISQPRHQDDTLRMIIIGDSWAEFHTNLHGDTIFDAWAQKLYGRPFKCTTRGKGYATSKDIYYYMFGEKTVEHSYDQDRCTQPLVEQHPDYCVIFAGINDAILRRPASFYTGNIRCIIRLLLHNDIRPVVMEMPLFSQPGGIVFRRFPERAFLRIRGILMGTWSNDVPFYRKALKTMLSETGLQDSVLYISANKWNPTGCEADSLYINDGVHLNMDGYHVLDSCITSEITKDYIRRNNKE